MNRYGIDDLIRLMACLRDPEHGCPWDLSQSYPQIVPFTLEEAHEVADAIERGAFDELPGELGDLLFQVVFYARLAEEEGRFDFSEIVHGLVEKLLRRHPHVFPDASFASFGRADQTDMGEIKTRWEQTKATERATRGQLGLFDDVPLALPALSRAQKIQKRASRAHFDWTEVGEVFAKLEEEVLELQGALSVADQGKIDHELGDVLFTVVNLSRHLGIDAEQALRGATARFESRMSHVLRAAKAQEVDLASASDEVKDALWRVAKQRDQ